MPNPDMRPVPRRPLRGRRGARLRALVSGQTPCMSHADEKKGTPARDTPDNEEFAPEREAVSDQQGETAPAGADEPTEGDDAA